MVVLTGNTLGERQRDLNQKVIVTASKNVDFNELRGAKEESDIDRIFKIDVASKYKNADYIVEVLKSGDPLYISRALKCEWLYADKYSNIINPDYLHQNVFPLMSLKMKRKLLTTISNHVRNESRAADFYTYCRNAKLDNLAYKFLLFTSECFKVEFLTKTRSDVVQINTLLRRPNDYIQHFVQNSFELAHVLVNIREATYTGIRELSYLYSVSDSKYLDMIEELDTRYNLSIKKFGLRLSKDIVTKHKDRVLKSPRTYVKILQMNVLVKHSTAQNAKIYLPALLPDDEWKFWRQEFCKTYELFIGLIPLKERFEFVEKIFTEKYPNKPFATTLDFYQTKCYTMMTTETRELWALRHIENQLELLGVNNDYIWYKFVSFDKAFPVLKKLLMINSDKDNRMKLLNVLIESAKNQCELKKLIDYFYTRHVNEVKYIKEQFLDGVLHRHNPFKFDENCWASFDKILFSLEVYSVTGYNNSKIEYRTIALIYHIIKEKGVPEAVQHYIDSHLNIYMLLTLTLRLEKEEVEMVYQYLFDFYIEKVNQIYNGEQYDDTVKHPVRKYIHIILDLLQKFDKTVNDCPETVMTLIKLDWYEYSHHPLLYQPEEKVKDITQDALIRLLKTDATLVVGKLPEVKRIAETDTRFQLNLILRKLKVYYPEDLSKKCVDYFNELLSGDVNDTVAQTAVYSIYHCADEHFKAEFMKKHAPIQSKIDHSTIDQNLLYIQQAICAYAHVSRPPVPLENVMPYIKGDYVQYCLPMFYSYLANLPTPLCIKFVESIIDAPVSVQKHGIKLAFACFNNNSLVQLVTSAWANTKNESLRLVIYRALYKKILAEDKDGQTQLYQPLKAFTLDICDDDDDELLDILISDKLPKDILGDYLETVWKAVSALPEKTLNLQYLDAVLKCMHRNMKLIRKELIETIIDEHIEKEITKEPIAENQTDDNVNKDKSRVIDKIVTNKWGMTAKYITFIESDDELASKLVITKTIMKSFIDKWDTVHDNKYTVRSLCMRFLKDLDDEGYEHDKTYYKYINVLLENILSMLQNSLPVEEIYSLILQLNFNIITRKGIMYGHSEVGSVNSSGCTLKRVREIGINLANEFGLLLQEYIKKDMYYATFLQEFKDKLRSASTCVFDATKEYRYGRRDHDDFLVTLCFGLTQLNTPETNLFALKLVPLTYDGDYIEDYKSVLNTLKKVKDRGFRCLMHHRFTDSNTTFRQY